MGKKLFTNNATAPLASSISAVASSCAAVSGSGSLFPAIVSGSGNSFQMTFSKVVAGVVTAQEIVTVTARTGDVFSITRGQEGTTALAWAAGDTMELLPTAAGLASFLQAADIQSGSTNFSVDTGTANAYVVGLTPPLAAHVVGMPIVWKATNTNTGASTFNDGAGAAALETPAGAALSANMVDAAGMFLTFWNGSVFILANPDWAGFALAAAAAALAAAEAFAENAGNISAGTVAAARLPLIANLQGLTISPDPGTVPSGPAGSIWFYY